MAVRVFEANWAALTRGDNLVVGPNSDRTVLRARNPPNILVIHTMSTQKTTETDHDLFTVRGLSGIVTNQPTTSHNQTHMVYLSLESIGCLKKAAFRGGKLKNCTTFHVVAAKIWKAMSIAVQMPEERISTMLFPVDARKRVVPQAPCGFPGNAMQRFLDLQEQV